MIENVACASVLSKLTLIKIFQEYLMVDG